MSIPRAHDPSTPDLFAQQEADGAPAPLSPARMDQLTHRLQVMGVKDHEGRLYRGKGKAEHRFISYKKKDYLLETAALLGDLYPTHVSADTHYQPLRPMVESFVREQHAVREASGVEAQMARPNFRTQVAGLADALHKASEELLAQADHTALTDAHARDVKAGAPSVYTFPAMARLAAKPPLARDVFHKQLLQAYKQDRAAIRSIDPDGAHSPLAQASYSLNVLYMVRWAQAAAALRTQLLNNELALSNPVFEGKDDGSWAASVVRGDTGAVRGG